MNNDANKNHEKKHLSAEELKKNYKECIKVIDNTLEQSTGHDAYNRQKTAYFAISTYFIMFYDTFPGYVAYGPPATGKTMTLNVLRCACLRPVNITGQTITDAALKAAMKEAYNGTLIIEEADEVAEKAIENILITRYSRSSADNKKMVPDGKDGWELQTVATFGATVAHRRNLFRDMAMLRRVITVQTKRTKKPEYHPFSLQELGMIFSRVYELMAKREPLPNVKNVWEIEPGIFDCYKPLVALVTFVEDEAFLRLLVEEMQSASKRLRSEETYLEAPALLNAIINVVSKKVANKPITPDLYNIEIRFLKDALSEEYGPSCPVFRLSSNQRNRILREDLGFTIKSSNGRHRLYFTLPQLIRTCEENGIEDECLSYWKEALLGDSQENLPITSLTEEEKESAWDTEDVEEKY